MRRSLRKKRRSGKLKQSDIELNVAAMLDMAFQLLAFFILTFKPGDVETQVSMLMPLDRAITSSAGNQNLEPQEDQVSGFGFPLEVRCLADSEGILQQVSVGGHVFQGGKADSILESTREKLTSILAMPGVEGIEIVVSPNLGYDYLIQVIDLCNTSQPKGLRRLSCVRTFVFLVPSNGSWVANHHFTFPDGSTFR